MVSKGIMKGRNDDGQDDMFFPGHFRTTKANAASEFRNSPETSVMPVTSTELKIKRPIGARSNASA